MTLYEDLRAERDHHERRTDRLNVLLDAGRYDSTEVIENAAYHEGARAAFDLALAMIARNVVGRKYTTDDPHEECEHEDTREAREQCKREREEDAAEREIARREWERL